jgi:hypothetical protein
LIAGIKSILRKTPLYPLVDARRMRTTLAGWVSAGCPVPPPDKLKQWTVREYARRYALTALVETGTYHGDMVEAVAPLFRRVYTIELGAELAEAARKRFAAQEHVQVLHGDSGRLLPTVLERLERPALFWLDAHYSGGMTARGEVDTPIVSEIQAILRHPCPRHVVLIDDARDFVGGDGYPSVPEIEALIRAERPDWYFYVEHDIMRAHPSEWPRIALRLE